jgi:hypothetical protein
MAALLNGSQLQIFADALGSGYNLSALERMLRYRLDKDIQDFAGAADKLEIIFRLLDVANREGWWPELIAAARASNSGNVMLIEAEAKLLAPVIPSSRDNLEKIVYLRSLFQNVGDFGRAYGRLETCVCAIEDTRGGRGTGWLIGTDLVITNFHVVQSFLEGKAASSDLRCRFDFKVLDGAVQPGRVVPLVTGDSWCIANRPYSPSDLSATASKWGSTELDYALLRLAEPLGDQPIGASVLPGAPRRGWVPVPSLPPSVEESDTLFLFQHPQDDSNPECRRQLPMKLADGKALGFVGGGLRLRHDVRTLNGSSGSPCCNAQLVPVALHHAGDPRDWHSFHGKWNQAIPLGLIVKDLQDQNIEPFWDKTPAAIA